MANWSVFSLKLFGERGEEAAAFLREMSSKNKEKYGIDGVWFAEDGERAELNDLRCEGETLTVCGEGRWSAPYEDIGAFAKCFGLSGTLLDAESGSDFAMRIVYESGEVVEEVCDDYISPVGYALEGDYIVNFASEYVNDKLYDDKKGLRSKIRAVKKLAEALSVDVAKAEEIVGRRIEEMEAACAEMNKRALREEFASGKFGGVSDALDTRMAHLFEKEDKTAFWCYAEPHTLILRALGGIGSFVVVRNEDDGEWEGRVVGTKLEYGARGTVYVVVEDGEGDVYDVGIESVVDIVDAKEEVAA